MTESQGSTFGANSFPLKNIYVILGKIYEDLGTDSFFNPI